MVYSNKIKQLHGPFDSNKNILETLDNFSYIKKIGIQSKPGTICLINGRNFEIGKTGILEFDEVKITSIIFTSFVDKNTLIDFISE